MAVYPNGRHMSKVAGRHFGGAAAAVGGAGAGFDAVQRNLRGNRLGRFAGEEHLPNASAPDGYGMQALVPPITAGSMSALVRGIEITGAGSLLQGGPMEGAGTITLTPDAVDLGLIVGLTGAGAIEFSAGAAALNLVLGMEGAGAITLTGTGALSMIVPIDGTGAITFTGAGDLKGRLSMDGAWSPFTALSPEGLASAVWGALAASNNVAGTMGSKLNTASSGGVDINALAEAAALETLAAMNATPPGVNVKLMNDAPVLGSGTEGDKWRGDDV